MTDTDHIEHRATGIAALPASDPERAAAEVHAHGCVRCAAALHEANAWLAQFDEAAVLAPLSAELLTQAQRDVMLRIQRYERRARFVPLMAVLVAWGIALLLARSHTLEFERWVAASALLLGALGFALLARRARWLSMGLSLAASVLVASQSGTPSQGSFALWHGLRCLGVELVAALVPYATLVMGALRTRDAERAPSFAATAVAGALAGQAALLITCPERASTPHQLVAHVTGVVLAALISLALQGVLVRRLERSHA
jgi:hypothetical protein